MTDELVAANVINSARDSLDKDRDKSTEEAHTSTSFINSLSSHIGSTGLSAHKEASIDEDTDGFMSTEDYDNYCSIPDKLQELEEYLENFVVPTGTCCWYVGELADLPSDWELVSNNSESGYYDLTTGTEGSAIHGINSLTDTIGTMHEVTGKLSTSPQISTIALYLIRKK